jgi:hypothetical protein
MNQVARKPELGQPMQRQTGKTSGQAQTYQITFASSPIARSQSHD